MPSVEFERGLRGFVATGSGIDVMLVMPGDDLPGDDKGPAPKTAYASVKYVEGSRDGYPAVRYDTNGLATIATPKTSLYSVQFYRAGAIAAAEAFEAWVESPLGLDAATEAGFQIEFPLELRRLDTLISDVSEERVGIDLTVHWVNTRTLKTPTVDRIEGTVIHSTPSERMEATVSHG